MLVPYRSSLENNGSLITLWEDRCSSRVALQILPYDFGSAICILVATLDNLSLSIENIELVVLPGVQEAFWCLCCCILMGLSLSTAAGCKDRFAAGSTDI